MSGTVKGTELAPVQGASVSLPSTLNRNAELAPLSQKKVAFERGQVVLAASTLAAGGIVGWVVPLIFSNPANIQLWVVSAAGVLVAAVSAAGLSFHNMLKATSESTLNSVTQTLADFKANTERELNQMLEANREIQKLAEQSIGRQAELIPRDEIYKVMANSIRNAQDEVAIVTYMMANWDTKKRTFLPAAVDTPYRGEFYDAVYAAIKDPKIEYIRIWEVPRDRILEARKVIEADEYHKKECALIDEVSRQHPHRARLIFAEQLTTMSFILIDRRSLFLNVDFYDPTKDVWYSPYMLFVKDASGDSFEDLQGVIIRLTEKS
jgi:hypothetical protein